MSPFNPMHIGSDLPPFLEDWTVAEVAPDYWEKLCAAIAAAPRLADDTSAPDPEPFL